MKRVNDLTTVCIHDFVHVVSMKDIRTDFFIEREMFLNRCIFFFKTIFSDAFAVEF